MEYTDYEKALSAARLSRYLHASGGNKDKSLSLYKYNIKLCQGFYSILGVFEVVLRNAINEHYKNYFSDRHPFRKGGQSLLSALPNRTRGLGQRTIYNELMEVKNFRNRIAHYEPICFDATGNKSSTFAGHNYELIMKYIHFLGYNKNELFLDINVLSNEEITQIDNF